MRFLLFIFIVLFSNLTLSAQSDKANFFSETNHFFQTYIINDLVDYSAIHKNPTSLESLVNFIKKSQSTQWNSNEQKAFWINAYNLLVIDQIIKHYPTPSPKEIRGFFEKKQFNIGKETLSLNDIENKKLLEKYKDARLHFVLICAAKSCPPIANFAFTPNQLEQQLESRTNLAINNSNFIFTNPSMEKVCISQIFNWYVNDFKSDGGVINFINQYRKDPLPPKYSIKYNEYDWTLNDSKLDNTNYFLERYMATTLLQKNQFEIKLFNALYTQRSYDGFERLNSRSSYFSSFGQFLFGVNKKLNVGFDLVYKSNLINDFSNNSPFNTLNFNQLIDYPLFPCAENDMHNLSEQCINDPGVTHDTLRNAEGIPLQRIGAVGLSHFGPKFKIRPVKKWKNISLQQTFFIPIQKEVDGQLISFSQLFIDKMLTSKSTLFIEASLWMPIHPNFRPSPFLKVFFSYFPSNRWRIYAMSSLPAEYGVGTKFLISPHLEIEFLYTHYLPLEFVVGHTRPSTFNIGFRYTSF